MAHKAAATASGADRISALHIDLRLRLLSLLPADEAVRAGLLSREWRGLWKKMPGLRLVYKETSRFTSAESFNSFVNKLLCLRDILPLDKCEIQAYRTNAAVPYPFADLWIKYALAARVRELNVSGGGDAFCKLRLDLPLISEHLRILRLCDVDVDGCSGPVDSQRCIDFSSCPLLEDLTMDHCSIRVGKITSMSLKWLRITNRSCFAFDQRTRISAPSLISLQLDNSFGAAPLLECMALLETAFVRLFDCSDYCDAVSHGLQGCDNQSCQGCYGFGHHQSVLLNALSNATHLELIAGLGVSIYRRDLAYCPVFGKLKTLLLNEWCAGIDLHGLVCILEHAPILEKLTIQLCNDELPVFNTTGTEGKHDPIEQSFACAHLQVVNIECEEIDGRVSEILKILSTCGIPREHISLKTTRSPSDYFSFEKQRDVNTLNPWRGRFKIIL
ncbi:unnamed protein product [Alopecurus aequalis]